MNKIYVGNLPFQTTEQDLDSMFQKFGKIKETVLIRDRLSREFKGFAFITFVTSESAQQALTLNGSNLQDRAIKVSMAKAETGGERSGGASRRSAGGYSTDRGGYGNKRNNSSSKRESRGRC